MNDHKDNKVHAPIRLLKCFTWCIFPTREVKTLKL